MVVVVNFMIVVECFVEDFEFLVEYCVMLMSGLIGKFYV